MQPPSPQRVLPSFQSRSILLFGGIAMLLSLRLDGWGNADLTVSHQLLILPFTAIFIGLVVSACLTLPHSQARPAWFWRLLRPVRDVSVFPLALACVALEQAEAVGLLVVQALYSSFKRAGYVLNMPAVLLVALLSAVAFAAAIRSAPVRRPANLLLAAGFGYALVLAYSIHFFPLNPSRSDNLPLIVGACHNFLSGHYPYVIYPTPGGPIVLTYLPVTWLSYLPAIAVHIDPRWTNLVLGIAAVSFAYLSVRPGLRLFAASLLSVFLAMPLSQYHHEIYVAPQWFLLAAAFAFLQRERWLLAAIVLGIGAAASQLFWIVIPFYLLFLLSSFGIRKAALALPAILSAAAVWMLPFFVYSPAQFVYAIWGHWAGGIPMQLPIRVYNATFWIRLALSRFDLVSVHNEQRVQAAALVLLFCFALRYRPNSVSSMWRWIAAAITLFAMTNFLVWSYFYLTAAFALLLGLLSATPSVDALEPEVGGVGRHPAQQTTVLL